MSEVSRAYQEQRERRRKKIDDREQQEQDAKLQEQSNQKELEEIQREATAEDKQREKGSKKEGFFTRAWRYVKNWFSFDKKNFLEGENKERNKDDSFQDFLIERVTFQEGYSSYANKAEDAVKMVQASEKTSEDEATKTLFDKAISRSRDNKGEAVSPGRTDIIYRNRLKLISPSANFKSGIFSTNSVEYTTDKIEFFFMGGWKKAKSVTPVCLYRDFSRGYDSLHALISIEKFDIGYQQLQLNQLLVRDSEAGNPDMSFVEGTADITSNAFDVHLSKMSIVGNNLDTVMASQAELNIKKAPEEFQKKYDFGKARVILKDSTSEIIPESETIPLGRMVFDDMIHAEAVDISFCQDKQLFGIQYAFRNYNLDINNPMFRITGVLPKTDHPMLSQDGTIRLMGQEGNSILTLFHIDKLRVPLKNPETLNEYVLGERSTKLNFSAEGLTTFGLKMKDMNLDVGKENGGWKAELAIGQLTSVSQEEMDAIRFLNDKKIFQLNMENVSASLSKDGLAIQSLSANCVPGGDFFQSTEIGLSISNLLLSPNGISFKKASGSIENLKVKDMISIKSIEASASKEAGKEADFHLKMEEASVDTDIIPGIRFVASKFGASYDKENGFMLSGNARMFFGKEAAAVNVEGFSYEKGIFSVASLGGEFAIESAFGNSPLKGKISVKGNDVKFGGQNTEIGGLSVSFFGGNLFDTELPEVIVKLDKEKGVIFETTLDKRWSTPGGSFFVENPKISFAIAKDSALESIKLAGQVGFSKWIEGSTEAGVELSKANGWIPKVSDLKNYRIKIPKIGIMKIETIEQTDKGYDMKNLSMIFVRDDNLETDQGIVPAWALPFTPSLRISLKKASLLADKIDWDSKDLEYSLTELKFKSGDFSANLNLEEKKGTLTYSLKAPKDAKENQIPDLLDISVNIPCAPAPVWVTAGFHAGAKAETTLALNVNFGNKDFLEANAGANVKGSAKIGAYIGIKVGVPGVATGTVKLSGDLIANADGEVTGSTKVLFNRQNNGEMKPEFDMNATSLSYSLSGGLEGKLTASIEAEVLKIYKNELFRFDIAKISLGTFHLNGKLIYGDDGFSLDRESGFTTDFNEDLFNPANPNSLIHKSSAISNRQKMIQTMLDNCDAIGFEEERSKIQTEQISEMQDNVLNGLEEILKTDQEALDALNASDSNIVSAMANAKKHIVKQKNRRAAAEHLTGGVMKGIQDINSLEDSYAYWSAKMSPKARQELLHNTGKSTEIGREMALKNLWMKENMVHNLATLDPLAALGAIRTLIPNNKLSKIKIATFSNQSPMEAAKELSIKNDRRRKGLLFELPKAPDQEELKRSKTAYGSEQKNAKAENKIIADTMKENYKKQSGERGKIAKLTKERLTLIAIANKSSEAFAKNDAQRILYEMKNYYYEDNRINYLKDNQYSEEEAKELAQKNSDEIRKNFEKIYHDSLKKKKKDDENLQNNTKALREAKEEYSVRRDTRGARRIERKLGEFKNVRTAIGTARQTYLSNLTASFNENSYFTPDEAALQKTVREEEKTKLEDEITKDNVKFLNLILGDINLTDYLTDDYRTKADGMNKSGFAADEKLLEELYSSYSISQVNKDNKKNGKKNTPLTIEQLDQYAEKRIVYYEDNLRSIDETRNTLEESVVWAGKQYKQAIGLFAKLQKLDTENMQVTYENISSGHQAIHRANALFLAAEEKYIGNDKLNGELEKKKEEAKDRFGEKDSKEYVNDIIKRLNVAEVG